VTTEINHQKQLLEVAYHSFEQVKAGHSYQSVTGTVPAAAERLMPCLADLDGADTARCLNYDVYDTLSTVTNVTSA